MPITAIQPGNAVLGKDGQYHKMGETQPDWYIGYNSNTGVSTQLDPTGGGYVGRHSSSKPKGYSRNVAKTATDIAQGGMTKEEIQEFNMRHPNETAGGI